MSKTNIEWVRNKDGSQGNNWNPFYGCRRKSAGCENCYAEQIAGRFSGIDKNNKILPYSGIATKTNGVSRWTGEVKLNENVLLEPLKIKKPTMFFVNSMSDTFYSKFPDEWIDKLFGVMARCPQHTFQILTKRPERMLEYIKTRAYHAYNDVRIETEQFPPRNIWLGVSVENQKTADERIPLLLDTPADVRFLSCEPLLENINLPLYYCCNCFKFTQTERVNNDKDWGCLICGCYKTGGFKPSTTMGIDWIIVGGESGANARPIHPDWARNIRDQCIAANVPFFFKQWGGWFPMCEKTVEGTEWSIGEDKARTHIHLWDDEQGNVSVNIGKHNAGRFLDGRTWNEFPG